MSRMMMEASGDVLDTKQEQNESKNYIITSLGPSTANANSNNIDQSQQQQQFHEQQHILTAEQNPASIGDLECSNYNHQCYICDKIFSANSNLNRHLRKIHQENVQSPYNNVKCALCDSVCSSSIIYNQHLETDHEVRIEVEQLTFPDKVSFEEWKHSIENQTTSQFIKSRGEKKTKNVNKIYYSCNRSGYYVSKARTRKALKKQGSRKINGRCPASMNVTINNDSTYDVRFVKTHVGHNFELKHLDLSDKDRDLIVQKLVSGVTKREIIKQIRSTVNEQHGHSTTNSVSPSSAAAGSGLPVVLATSTCSLTNTSSDVVTICLEAIPTTSEIVISNATSTPPVDCAVDEQHGHSTTNSVSPSAAADSGLPVVLATSTCSLTNTSSGVVTICLEAIPTTSEIVISNATSTPPVACAITTMANTATCTVLNSSNSQPTSRLHLATTKDIHNIINSKHLDSKLIRHKYDLNNVEAWIKEMKEKKKKSKETPDRTDNNKEAPDHTDKST